MGEGGNRGRFMICCSLFVSNRFSPKLFSLRRREEVKMSISATGSCASPDFLTSWYLMVSILKT